MSMLSLAFSRAAAKAVNDELHKPKNGDGKTVHLPKLLLIIGIICTAVFLIPACVLVSMKEIVPSIFLFVMSLLGLTLIVAYCNQRVYYDDEGFTSKTFFGIKRRFSYTDIEYVKGDVPPNLDEIMESDKTEDVDKIIDMYTEDIRLTASGKNIYLDQISIGRIEFLAFAQKQYKLRNGGRSIPEEKGNKKKSKFDAVFNGNVKNPGVHLFAYTLVPLLFVVLLIIALLTNNPTAMEDLSFDTVNVNSYSTKGEYLEFNVDGFKTEPYIRGYDQTVTDSAKLYSLLDEGEAVKIGYVTIVDDGVAEYRIEYLEDAEGNVYTTPEANHEYYQHDFKGSMIFVALFILLWICFGCFTIYVGRNPRKFSKKLVYKLYGKDHIRI